MNYKARPNLSDIPKMTEDELRHYGVLGMKWGVRRPRNRPGGADGISESKKRKTKDGMAVPKSKAKAKPKPKKKGTIAKNLESMKRERDWKKVLNNVDKLTTTELRTVSKRVSNENALKKLSKNKDIATKKDREDYLRRGKMSDQELVRKVNRLQVKDSLSKSVKSASLEQRQMGEKIVNVAKVAGSKYAISKVNKQPISAGDIMDIINTATASPKASAERAASQRQKTRDDAIRKAVETGMDAAGRNKDGTPKSKK